MFSSTNTRGGFSDSWRRARPRRSRASTRSASVAVRFRLECLLDAREAPEGEVVGLGGKRPVVLHVGGEVGAGLEGEVRVHLILTS